RMDFVRFTGESFIYGVLILCGVAVLNVFTMAIFSSAGFDPDKAMSEWLLPVCVFAAPAAAMRLALAKRSVVETIAPVLARIFAPLFLAAMLAFVAATLAAGRDPFADRNALVLFDVVLAVVVALVLFSTAMRDPRAASGVGDWVDLGLAVAALGIDAALLAVMAGRIGAWGLTPNRIAALGENLVFLAEFAGTAVILGRHLLGKGRYEAVIRWQVAFIPVAFAWAGVVALVLPLVFGGA
ncbi:MAG: hypothetical protein Q8M76_08400, partial [Spirochaetaceae bacterium]|nr:hypothetical protein [Spirochaetaceae bacterium]